MLTKQLHPGMGSLALILWFCLAGLISAQQTETEQFYKITDIVFKGNKKTKTQVLQREMMTQTGDTVSVNQLELDRKRIENLGLFTRVQLEGEVFKDGIRLIFTVSERWYFLPLPVLFFNDREYKFKKLSYGATLLHLNFRGMAEVVQFDGLLGFNPGISIQYRNPWILGDARLFLGLRFFASRIQNKSAEIRGVDKIFENQTGASVTLGKRVTLRTSVSVSLGYKQLRISPADSATTLNPTGFDRLPEAFLSLTRDYRDLAFYPTSGSLLQLTLQKTGIPGNRFIDYNRVSVDARKYFKLGENSTLAFRSSTSISSGTIPIYDRLYFGFTHRIRGYFGSFFEGEKRWLASAALRFPLMPVRFFNLDESKLGPYGQNLKFGISGSLFFDAGTLWSSKSNVSGTGSTINTTDPFMGQIRAEKWLYGYGIGLNFHMPYVNVTRVEWALNDQKKSSITFDLEVAF